MREALCFRDGGLDCGREWRVFAIKIRSSESLGSAALYASCQQQQRGENKPNQ